MKDPLEKTPADRFISARQRVLEARALCRQLNIQLDKAVDKERIANDEYLKAQAEFDKAYGGTQ